MDFKTYFGVEALMNDVSARDSHPHFSLATQEYIFTSVSSLNVIRERDSAVCFLIPDSARALNDRTLSLDSAHMLYGKRFAIYSLIHPRSWHEH